MRIKKLANARRTIVIAILGIPLLFSAVAHAEASDADRTAAQNLFDEAKTLMDQAKYPEACAKFEASLKAVAGIGTRFNLADCHEKADRIASAWANFRSVADASRARGDSEREQVAQQRADALLPRLSYVTITVQQPTPGQTIKCDNVEVPPAAWGTALPLDNGTHHIEAVAPDKKPWTQTVALNQDGSKVDAQIPPLQDTTVPVPSVAHGTHRSSTRTTWAIISGAVGVAGLGIGAGMVLSAEHTYSNADCGANNQCSKSGAADRSSAIHRANWSMLPLGICLAGIGTGLTFWFVKPLNQRSERPVAGLMLSPNELAVRGRF